MGEEENISQDLIQQFSYLAGRVRIPRSRRIFIETGAQEFRAIFDYAVKTLKFSHLCTITGLDEGEDLGFIYHLSRDSGVLLNLKISLPKENPLLKSVIPYFSGAEIYERELVDLFGAKVEGLPAGNRYPLTDDWPVDQHPLRKDWKPSQDKEKEAGKNA